MIGNLQKKYRNEDTKYFLFLLALVLLLKLPTLAVDYHWDGLEYAAQAKYYSVYGLFTIPPGPIVHVPFLQWSLAVLYVIFGESPVLSNFVIAIFSFIGAYYTYLLGKNLYDKKVGVVASLLLFFSPIYFSISGQVLFDIPLTAMTVATLYYGIKRKLSLYLLSASILVLTKEPGFLVIIAFAVSELFRRKNNFKIKIKNIFAYSIPMIFLLLWWVWIWMQTGNFLDRPDLKFPEITPAFFLQKLFLIGYTGFFWNYEWMLLIFIFLAFLKFKLKFVKNESMPLILTLIFYIILFAFQVFLPRYLLPICPIFFIFASYSIAVIAKKREWIILLIMIILFASCYRWNWGVKGMVQDPVFQSKNLASLESGELSLDYLDMVKAESDALQYIFTSHPNSTISTYFPFAYKASSVVDIGHREWSKYGINVLMLNKESITKSDLIAYEPYSSWTKEQINLLPKINQIERFEINGKEVLIYKISKGA